MAYCKVTNGQADYYTLGLLRREHPEVNELDEITTEAMAQYDVYPVIEDEPPEFDQDTECLEEQYDFVTQEWHKVWVVMEKSQEELAERAIEQAKLDRRQAEEQGVVWEHWYFDTTHDSQARHSGAVTAISQGMRDGGVWKCAEVVDGKLHTVFVELTNAELLEVSTVIHDWVQDCFMAEANTVMKIEAGDLTASFYAELELITG